LLGGEELLAHAEEALGIKAGGTTADGMFTIEDVECIAACTEAPCLQVNYRYKLRLTTDDLDQLIDDIRNSRATDIPEHGTLGLVRQHIPAGAGAGIVAPEQATERPVWLARNDTADEGGEA
jgi:NADH-quinone oxidoreductase subunit E